MTFFVDSVRHDAGLRAEEGLLRHAALAVTSDAMQNAERIHSTAQARADQLLLHAKEEAAAIVARAELDTVERMREQMAAFDDQYVKFTERAQPLIRSLVLALFDKLLLSLEQRDRIEAAVRRLQQEAPAKLSEAVLHLNPADIAHMQAAEWPVRADPGLAPGCALLAATSGEWRMDFTLAINSLKDALSLPSNAIPVSPEAAASL